ncbi:MAG: hypothetical protein CR972_02805 [Candidatus Moraniibacteriota bacterium]|nr:MAG: hypothetical protein CR972_02805 [Candidatus Moranbacteria bacterium]
MQFIVNRNLAKNIVATITYYDVLDYPLTSFEVWKHLIDSQASQKAKRYRLSDVDICLQEVALKKYISEKNGFYFLCGREKLIKKRKEREIISLQKIKKLQRIVSILRFSPFVRMICVTGRLAYKNCEENSDLDVLVVYKSGHIWTGRFFITVLSHVIGVRRYGDKTSDRVCLNYHITTESLSVPTRDLFAAHEYSFIFPLYDNNNFFEKFCEENMWIQNYKPQYSCEYKKHVLTVGDYFFGMILRSLFEIIFADKGMENRLRDFQGKKIANNLNTSLEGAMILYNDRHLVFLPRPHGPEVFEEYKKRLDALEIDL